jgi:hypothetical protein
VRPYVKIKNKIRAGVVTQGKALGSILSTTKKKKKKRAGHQWLMPVILATQEAEISRIEIQRQSVQIVPETLS